MNRESQRLWDDYLHAHTEEIAIKLYANEEKDNILFGFCTIIYHGIQAAAIIGVNIKTPENLWFGGHHYGVFTINHEIIPETIQTPLPRFINLGFIDEYLGPSYAFYEGSYLVAKLLIKKYKEGLKNEVV